MRWHLRAVRLPDGDVPEDIGDGGTELPGRYALPGGLVDAHSHLSIPLGGSGLPLGSAELVAENYSRNRRAGVLGMRDCGQVPGSEVDLPGVVPCGRFLAPAGRYFDGLFEPVHDLLGAAVAQHTSWVKAIADFPSDDGNWLTAPVNWDGAALAELVRVAERAHKRVAAHVSSAHVRDCVAAGVHSVEHGPLMDLESLSALGARGGAWTPTLATVAAVLEQIPPAAPVLSSLGAALAAAAGAGVRVLAGSDEAGAGNLHREVAYLMKYGLCGRDALAAASVVPRAFLGLPAGGVVTYDRDPRLDPSVLAAPIAVIDAAGTRLV